MEATAEATAPPTDAAPTTVHDTGVATADDAPGPLPASSRWSTALWVALSAVLVIVMVGVWLNVHSGAKGASIANALVKGERPDAPSLPTRGIPGDGAPGYSAAAARGQVVVVNFWASWCGPCKDEAPVLQGVAEQYEGRVTVVGLDAGSEDLESDARAFVREHQLTFPIVRGDRSDKDAWGIGGYPETFVVGVDGRISAHVDGQVDRDTLRALLDHELDQARHA